MQYQVNSQNNFSFTLIETHNLFVSDERPWWCGIEVFISIHFSSSSCYLGGLIQRFRVQLPAASRTYKSIKVITKIWPIFQYDFDVTRRHIWCCCYWPHLILCTINSQNFLSFLSIVCLVSIVCVCIFSIPIFFLYAETKTLDYFVLVPRLWR